MGKEYVRYGARDWRYADEEDIQVPGGRDMRLSERFDPIIGSRGNEKAVVIIEGADVEASPEALGWALSVGTPVRDQRGNLLQVIVPFEAWEDHDQIEGIMVAPELDDDEGVRELAAVQLQLRKTERQLAGEAAERDNLLVKLAAAGMTRQRAAEITGLSVGKVQQIIKSEELAANELVLVKIVADHDPIDIAAIVEHAKKAAGLTSSKSKLKRYLKSLAARGFLDGSEAGQWTATGKAIAEMQKRQAGKESPPSDGAFAARLGTVAASAVAAATGT
jgi:hypothetical protein